MHLVAMVDRVSTWSGGSPFPGVRLRLGEVGVAFVITRPDSGITGNEVTSFAREHMANFNVPRRGRDRR
jgi:hypothetical protein